MKTKRLFSFLMVLMMLFTSFAVSQPVGAAPEAKQIHIEPVHLDAPHVEGEIVVMMANMRGKTLPAVVAQAFAKASEKGAQLTRLTGDGTMVLRVNDDQLAAKLDELNNDPDVLYAEPNYTFSLPDTEADNSGYKVNSEYVTRSVQPSAESNWSDQKLVSTADLQSMKTKVGATVMATYPNDPGVFQNYGWAVVGADIVWPNTTASPGICVVDTGADTLHKDLLNKFLPGYDFVWGDSIPQDDHGHGTHVTGIIAANQNNALGIAGASNAKVAAIKVLDAQGVGTNFDVAAGITACANRLDIRVINLSLGGPDPSTTLANALTTAVTKNKLVVVAAGNNGSSTKTYPAGYADTTAYPQYANKVIAVAASGKDLGGTKGIDYTLPYPATTYGSWVSVVAPGGYIYSTTPWDKSFYLNYYQGVETRFDTLSGTSMAAPFVSAAAARYWGYKPALTNAQVGLALKDPTHGTVVITGTGKWDSSMNGKVQVNIAKLMDRGALEAGVMDAANGTPLQGAVISAYQGGVARGSAIIPALSFTDIINLPVLGGTYTLRVNKAGYTASAQPAFQHDAALTLTAGTWTTFTDTAVPPQSPNFTVVLVWKVWKPFNGATALKDIDKERGIDLDMDIWLPPTPNSYGVLIQPSTFIVGNQSDDYNFNVGDKYGAMTAFPFARLVREGGYTDNTAVETIVVRNRFAANGAAAINAALPFYPDVYSIYVTDYGQTIDHDNDGCGDNYGRGAFFNPAYDNTCGGSGTPGIPIMGTYLTPYVYVWKDGLLKKFSDGSNGGTYWPPQTAVPNNCNDHWWKALTITSGLSGSAPSYEDNIPVSGNPGGECSNGQSYPPFYPYLDLPQGSSSSD